jgi:hypothetical protein
LISFTKSKSLEHKANKTKDDYAYYPYQLNRFDDFSSAYKNVAHLSLIKLPISAFIKMEY